MQRHRESSEDSLWAASVGSVAACLREREVRKNKRSITTPEFSYFWHLPLSYGAFGATRHGACVSVLRLVNSLRFPINS